jgi:hypothetical protein
MLEHLLILVSLWVTPVPPTAAPTPVPVHVPVGLDIWGRPDVWSIPFYAAQPSGVSQPLLYNEHAWYRVASGRWRRFGNVAEVEREIIATSRDAFPHQGNVYSSTTPRGWSLPRTYNRTRNPASTPARFILPPEALPAAGPDGHMAVQQPDGTVLETYGSIRLSSGTLVALSYSVTDPRRLGDGYENGQTASMVPMYLGLLSDDEVASGEIRHALAITIPAGLLAPAIRYPAFAMDRNALDHKPPYGGTLPMGSRLVLPPDASPDLLQLSTSEGRTIARAAQRFGFIVVDRGGEGVSLRALRNPQRPMKALRQWSAGLDKDLRTIFSHVALMPSQPAPVSSARGGHQDGGGGP